MNNLNAEKFECSGCFLCTDICPEAAIKIERDIEGFYKYLIDDKKCTLCGLCVKKCSQLSSKSNNEIPKQCYAAYSKEDEILLNSSSGGIFSELATSFLEDEAIVIGATWEDNDIKHICINAKKDLEKLRGSKYLQSNLVGVYKRIQKELESGKKVLFSGLPCQVAALNNYIQHDNLYLIDIVCHGIPSKQVFTKSSKDRFKKEFVKVDFRNKKLGWNNYFINYEFRDGSSKSNQANQDSWFSKYIQNLFLNKSCYNCKQSKLPRPGDISLGDFWGIQNIDQEFFPKNQDKGVSVVLINNSKGQMLYDSIAEQIISKKEPLELACKYNSRINKGDYDAEHLKRREKFFKAYANGKVIFKDDSCYIRLYKRIRYLAGYAKRKIIK